MKRTAPRRNSAFTLIELLVVIAIIGILAAALFPAVSGAILRAQATAFSNRGRNIVMAVINANLEREREMLGVIWPHGAATDNPNYPRVGNAASPVDWIKNQQNRRDVRGNLNPRLEGIDPSMFSGAGIPAAPNWEEFGDRNLAWGMTFNLLETDSETALFMITRNFPIALVADGEFWNVPEANLDQVLQTINPFGDKMIVYVRKGGGASSIRPDTLFEAIEEEGRIDILQPRAAMSARGDGYIAPIIIYPSGN